VLAGSSLFRLYELWRADFLDNVLYQFAPSRHGQFTGSLCFVWKPPLLSLAIQSKDAQFYAAALQRLTSSASGSLGHDGLRVRLSFLRYSGHRSLVD
jgi:hypothetical protein